MRANFGVWREGVDPHATRHFIMFNPGDKTPQEVVTYPMGSERLNAMLPRLLAAINGAAELREKVNDVRLLTTLSDQALVTVTYHRCTSRHLSPVISSRDLACGRAALRK